MSIAPLATRFPFPWICDILYRCRCTVYGSAIAAPLQSFLISGRPGDSCQRSINHTRCPLPPTPIPFSQGRRNLGTDRSR